MIDVQKFVNILNRVLYSATKYHEINRGKNLLETCFSDKQISYVTNIVNNVETQKSILAVLITSLLKKIENPKQDIRYHREEFKNGYSGRSLDTNVTTPWLKEHFPKFAPKESGWLTRSIEQPSPFTKRFPGKIRNKKVKSAFLSILEDIEKKNASAETYLTGLFLLLLDRVNKEIKAIENLPKVKSEVTVSINQILEMLRNHFLMAQSSRLPVIAIYSIYQILSSNIGLYKGKKLQPLKSHTTSDKYTGYGDIEIYYSDGNPFEIVEVKHGIPIDLITIEDVLKKVKSTSVKRYFILTTAEPNFSVDEKEIFGVITDIKRKYNIDIITNGIIPSLKYYLRFVDNPIEFVNMYTENLKREFQQATDIKEIHIKRWAEIIEEFNLNVNK